MKISRKPEMKISSIIKLADFFTIANFSFGMLSIFFSMRGEFTAAAVMLLCAVAMDFLDGRIARATGTTNEFGKQLDSLSDLLSFGVAPAVFGYGLGLKSPIAIIVLIYFAVCGMLRLARFNISKEKGFIGVPITVNGLLFPVIYFIIGGFNNYILFFYIIMALLMISTIKIKKL